MRSEMKAVIVPPHKQPSSTMLQFTRNDPQARLRLPVSFLSIYPV